MTRKKPYHDGCATAHALDLIGERWALLIIRELIPGPKRFTDLKLALPGISTNVLTTRLTELEAAHIATRRVLPPPAAVQVYELTPWGSELEPLIRELGRWAARSPSLEVGKPMSAASVMLSLRTMFHSERARGFQARISLILGQLPHRAEIHDEELRIEVGQAENPDAELAGDPNLVAAIIYAGLPIDEAQRAGLAVTGDRAVIERFITLFPLPEPAPRTTR